MADLYASLGVAKDATPEQIKRAHRKGVMQHHPDKGGDPEQFAIVLRAYVVLSDPDKRARYDATGDDGSDAMPKNEMSEIAALVIGAFDRAVQEVAGKFRQKNIVDKMKALLRADKARGEEANRIIVKNMASMEEMRKRLGFTGEEGKNLIDSMLLSRLRDGDDQQRMNNEMLARVDQAIEHVELYGWEVDPEPEFKGFHSGGQIDPATAEAYIREMMRDMAMGSFGRSFKIKPEDI